jgi:hypothetical protein
MADPHMALCQSESASLVSDKPWQDWVSRVESLIGHDLDGNQYTDGYSLDQASDAFDRGDTPEAHAQTVMAAIAARKPTFFTVAVYLIDQAYGGPEEGGWWYECGERIDTAINEGGKNVAIPQIFTDEAAASAAAIALNDGPLTRENRLRRSDIGSVLSEGRYVARVCDGYPEKSYPAARPHYE